MDKAAETAGRGRTCGIKSSSGLARHGLQILERADGLRLQRFRDANHGGEGAHPRWPARQPRVNPNVKVLRQLIRRVDCDHNHIGREGGANGLHKGPGIAQGNWRCTRCSGCAPLQPVWSPGDKFAWPTPGSRHLGKPPRCSKRIPVHPGTWPPGPTELAAPEAQSHFS